MDTDANKSRAYPLPISRGLEAADKACAEGRWQECHGALMRLAEYIVYYLGAVAVGRYTQALYLEQAQPDPTLSRSLRALRRISLGQWLGWTARSLAATPDGPVKGMAAWYSVPQGGELAGAYEALRQLMVGELAYTGEFGPREQVSPRMLLELTDQYAIRRGKANSLPPDIDERVAKALLPGLRALLESAPFLGEYQLYAPHRRQLLMGLEAVTPMPPIIAPGEAEASLLLYPPGEPPDYTKRPNLQSERLPLFPLDPLLAYVRCPQCDHFRVAALKEVVNGAPSYLGLDPDCDHTIRIEAAG